MSGIRISSSRIEPLMMKVTIIQYLLLLLIFPADSNVESSNMASLESGVGYFLLDTAETSNVPRASKLRQTTCSTPIPERAQTCKGCLETRCSCPHLQRAGPLPRIVTCEPVSLPEEQPPCPYRHATPATPPASAQRLQSTNKFLS